MTLDDTSGKSAHAAVGDASVQPSTAVIINPDSAHADDQVGVPDPIRDEIAALLPKTKGQIGLVAACLAQGITDRSVMVEEGAAANTGAVATRLSDIRAIRDGQIPTAPTLAQHALSASRSFLKQHNDVLSEPATKRLAALIETLEAVVDDRSAQEREEEELQKKGDELENILAATGGVYVFTFPHYWRHPTVDGTRRTLLKVGMTTKNANERVRQQARQTSIPEDPLLLRVYQHETTEPKAAEKAFHRLLVAADHSRGETKTGGTEWFETSVEFLDTIALTLGMKVHTAEIEETV